ncbi:MAG: universal stress protein [Halapricum sp.]
MKTAVERTTSFEGAAAGVREYVEENGVDLVIMESHGRSNLKRQLLGSVASTVLPTVDVPVLVVKRSG